MRTGGTLSYAEFEREAVAFAGAAALASQVRVGPHASGSRKGRSLSGTSQLQDTGWPFPTGVYACMYTCMCECVYVCGGMYACVCA